MGVAADKETFEDVTLAEINAFIKGLEAGEEINLEIDSWGGDVAAGLGIASLLRQASKDGHKTTAHVIGVACSMASVLACSCDRLIMDSDSLMCIHLPWTVLQGNAEDMRKEIEVLDKYTQALISIYKTKFDLSEDDILKLLKDETWILASAAPMYSLNAEIIPVETERRYAASMKGLKHFKNVPKIIMDKLTMEDTTKEQASVAEEEIKATAETTADEAVEENTTVEEPATETTAEEPQPEEPQAETPADEKPQAEELVPKAEVDKRVSGMQSTMAKKIDAMRKDYEAKIADYETQIKNFTDSASAKDKELSEAHTTITSLSQTLETTKRELAEKTSALESTSNSLAALNCKVNSPRAELNTKEYAMSLKGQAFLDFLNKHPEIAR